MTYLVRLLLVLALCDLGLPAARGAERVGDALTLYAFDDRTQAVTALESDLLDLIAASPDEDRFELYRTYGALAGAWVQVELAQTLIGQAMTATSPAQEEEIRATLRDQAQFALWELDEAHAYLERNVPSADRWPHLRINVSIRSLLDETRPIFGGLVTAQ